MASCECPKFKVLHLLIMFFRRLNFTKSVVWNLTLRVYTMEVLQTISYIRHLLFKVLNYCSKILPPLGVPMNDLKKLFIFLDLWQTSKINRRCVCVNKTFMCINSFFNYVRSFLACVNKTFMYINSFFNYVRSFLSNEIVIVIALCNHMYNLN